MKCDPGVFYPPDGGKQYDSGFYNSTSFASAANSSDLSGLADWEAEILNLWSTHIGRSASNTDVLLFRGLLKAKEEAISARLRLPFEGKNQTRLSKQGVQFGDTTTLPWLDQAFTCLTDHTESPMAALDVLQTFNQTPSAVNSMTFPNPNQ
jgi:hypothetical protein